MHRTWAIIERELRRFRRSPVLIAMSLVFPIVQLVILGYAFGGNVKHLKVAIVDQDHSVPAVRVRELASAVSSGARTIDTIDYADQGEALTDLRNGRVNGVLTIPPEFSRRVLERNQPRIALIEDNTDSFVSSVRYYADSARYPWQPSHDRSPMFEAPAGVTLFLNDGASLPNKERLGNYNVHFLKERASGGHFGPLEEAAAVVEDIRQTFRDLR